MREPTLLSLLLLAAVPAVGSGKLELRPDPANPGRVLVGSDATNVKEKVDVIYERNGWDSVFFRSPDSTGFEVCAFLRYARLEKTPGPIDINVWRGDAYAPLRLEYDGKSCAEAPMATPTPAPKRLAPLAIPTMPPPPPQEPVEGEVDRSFAVARLERVAFALHGRSYRFRARFDRNVSLPAGTRVLIRSFVRPETQKRVLEKALWFPARTSEGAIEWKVPSSQLEFKPPLRKGEKLKLSFEIGERAFDGQLATAEGTP